MTAAARFVVSALAGSLLCAQEYRATVLGVVTDPTGAAVPLANVTITNNETGVVATTQAGNDGAYQIPFLLPGTYTVKVEHPGFKTLERGPVELRVNDRMRLDLKLQVGEVSDQVTVVAEAPLVEQSNADRGQVIDNRKVTDLPLDSRNPFSLMNLAAGVQYTGALIYSRPYDNGAISDFSINGGRTGINEYQIDGVSNNLNTGRSGLAYVPPVEATQEFKVQTNIYDAQYGRTAGGVVSVSIKPGTNRFHGTAYEYLRRKFLEANQFANNAAGEPRADRLADQYGVEFDGPVMLPKLYRGRDRTFFMFSFEKHRESTPQPALGSVPTPEQRQGDFSQTLTASGRLYTIHDALTNHSNPDFNPAKPVSINNLQNLRDPFPGNQVPASRTEPIAVRVLRDIPLPNRPGDPVTRVNNWFAGGVTEVSDFDNLIGRVDHTINGSWKMYARANHNYRDGGRINYWGWNTPARREGHGERRNDGIVLDAVGTISAHTILSVRAGFNRFKQSSLYTPVDISTLGLPKSFIGQLQVPDRYPQFTFENYLQAGGNLGDINPSETYTAQAGLVKILGKQSIKFGGEYRLMHYANIGRNNASGTFSFTRSWTGKTTQVNDPNSGNSIASFLLGYMNSATATLSATPYLSWRYPVAYFQHDWQAARRLTVNMGLRWDYESPPLERYNRQNRGFDFKAKSPYPVEGLDARGGLLYTGVNGHSRGAFDPDYNNVQPRFGMAYKVLRSRPLVFRGGGGRAFLPTTEFGGSTGFSQTTNAEVSTVEFRTFRLLSNPFPNGLVQPPGAGLGLATQVGDSITFSDIGRKIPNVWQFSAGFQYELRPGLLIEATYSGSRTRQVQVSKNLNYLTPEQLALGTVYLNQSQPNPFYGVLPANTSRGQQATISRRTLMLPYPHFVNVTMQNQSLGRSWYNSAQVKIEQRFKRGVSFLISYTNSKTMEMAAYRSPQYAELSRELVSFDIPQRLTLSGIWEFPFGRRKAWLKTGIASKFAGGWQVSYSGTVQPGPPMSYPDYYLYGNPKLESGQSLNRWFDTSREIWVQRPPDTLRTIGLRSPNIRRYSAPQFSTTLTRSFRLGERRRLQLKFTAFNLTNTPIFGFPTTDPASPLFGVVKITQINLPRSMELGFRYSF